NLLFSRAGNDVATGAAAGADALGFLQKPNAHLEAKIFRGQGPNRTDIDRVQRIIIVKRFARVMRERVVTATIYEAQRIVAYYIFREADAARTKNAALNIQNNARTKVDLLGFVDLRFDKSALGLSIIDRVLLQFAFARLVADRAIQRMVNQQEFE